MAKAKGQRPLHGGGRTLSDMGRKTGSSHGRSNRKATWFQLNGRKFGDQAPLGCYVQGDPLMDVRAK